MTQISLKTDITFNSIEIVRTSSKSYAFLITGSFNILNKKEKFKTSIKVTKDLTLHASMLYDVISKALAEEHNSTYAEQAVNVE